jgi:hypothetical protein
VSALVIRWQVSDYGYAYTENWEVHYLPKKLTNAQAAKVAELEPACHTYFTGPGTGWGAKVGIVRFQVSTRNLPDNEHRELLKRLPIDVKAWGAFSGHVVDEKKEYVDPDHPVQLWIDVAPKPRA